MYYCTLCARCIHDPHTRTQSVCQYLSVTSMKQYKDRYLGSSRCNKWTIYNLFFSISHVLTFFNMTQKVNHVTCPYPVILVMEWVWPRAFHNASIHSITDILLNAWLYTTMSHHSVCQCVLTEGSVKRIRTLLHLPDKGAKSVFHCSFYDSLAFGLIIQLWCVISISGWNLLPQSIYNCLFCMFLFNIFS